MIEKNSVEWQAEWLQGVDFCQHFLDLSLGDITFRIVCNSDVVLSGLRSYFSHLDMPVVDERPVTLIQVVEGPALSLDVPFADWPREPGKVSRKDAYYDLTDGRLLHKVRTGMTFLQSQTALVASGPCQQNLNQVINFINTQFMTCWLQQEWLICHAACIDIDGTGIAVAGFSGGGKSTMMLHMMEHQRARFVSNDRLFIRREDDQLPAWGVPKLPRINPGTIANNPRLRAILPPARLAEIEAMPTAELWDLEEKYDVDVESIYGDGRIVHLTNLKHFVVLNWQRDSQEPPRLEKVDISEARHLLAAIMKAPGPFYQQTDGQFLAGSSLLPELSYLQSLAPIQVYQVVGGVDFAHLNDLIIEASGYG